MWRRDRLHAGTVHVQECGNETSVIGYEESEQLDVEPARYFVAVMKREKRACRSCAQRVGTAPVAERIVEKGLASDAVVINTLVSEYSDYLPLYRQSLMLSREAGLEISRATMDGWVLRCGELLRPVAAAIGRELLSGGYIQADETPVPVQMHNGRGKNHQAYLWQYGRPGASTMFDFRTGRGREGPKKFLANYQGILQTDGYSAYERTGGANIVHAACWAHSRRKLLEAVKLSPDDRVAAGSPHRATRFPRALEWDSGHIQSGVGMARRVTTTFGCRRQASSRSP